MSSLLNLNIDNQVKLLKEDLVVSDANFVDLHQKYLSLEKQKKECEANAEGLMKLFQEAVSTITLIIVGKQTSSSKQKT